MMFSDHTKREMIYLALVLILSIGFLLSVNAKQQDIKEYSDLYYKCMEDKYKIEHSTPLTFNYTGDLNEIVDIKG